MLVCRMLTVLRYSSTSVGMSHVDCTEVFVYHVDCVLRYLSTSVGMSHVDCTEVFVYQCWYVAC